MCTVSSGSDRNDSPHWMQRRMLRRVRSPPPDSHTSCPRTSFEYSAGRPAEPPVDAAAAAAELAAGDGRSAAAADAGRVRSEAGAAGA